MPGFGAFGYGLFLLGSPSAAGAVRDTDAYEPLLGMLRDLDGGRAFAAVVDAREGDADQVAADQSPIVVMTPTGRFREEPDGSVTRRIRVVEFELTVKVREPDPAIAYRQLDRLNALLHNALEGQSLGGFTLPHHASLISGQYVSTGHPNYVLPLAGRFGYALSTAYTGYRTTE